MKKFSLIAGAVVAGSALLGGVQANAASIAVNDHSFEQEVDSLDNGLLGIGADFSGTIGGWDYRRTSLLGLLPPNTGSYASPIATDGNNVAAIGSLAGVAGAATISQTLAGVQYEANTTYTLQVDVSNVGLADVLSTGPGIALTSDGDVVASSASGVLLSILDLNPHFKTWELSFTTDENAPTGDIGITLFSGTLADVIGSVSFDNVRLDASPATAVPSPATAQVGLAALSVLGLRRRRRQQLV